MDEAAENRSLTIIAGYGLPGRVAAEVLRSRNSPHRVIELNPQTVERCAAIDTPIIAGDCTDPAVLLRAGIEKAGLFLVLIPDDAAALAATAEARRLNPSIRIITRCHYVSTGNEARRRGADDVIVAEQVVASAVSERLL